MAFISLQDMYNSWKRVSDWVSGANTDKPAIKVVNAAGTEIFTSPNPGAVSLTGSNAVKITSDGSPTGTLANVGNFSSTDQWPTGFNQLGVGGYTGAFNNTSWDRWRNNSQGTLLATAARTSTTTSPVQTNHNARGVLIFLYVSASSGTGGLQVRIDAIDPINSGIALAANPLPTPITSNVLACYLLYPGASGMGYTQAISAALPRTWQLRVFHIDASSYTYSVGYSYIV